jgi:hypothetical protein
MSSALLIAICSTWPAAAQRQRPAGPTPAAAQRDDTGAINKRFQDFYAAGNYFAALEEAQKYEVAVKAQFGTSHVKYGSALNNLARVYRAQAVTARRKGFSSAHWRSERRPLARTTPTSPAP